MKPCKICKQAKGYHNNDGTWDNIRNNNGWSYSSPDIPKHKFEMDNLAFLEKKLRVKELEEKHRKLNFCMICKNIRKSPFGICQECSVVLIEENV